MNKQELANKIWESANQMRSKIEANEYKDYILGFIFYKYLSDKEYELLINTDFEKEDIEELSEDDSDTVDFIQKNLGYFISYENLFSTWLEMGKDFSVDNVIVALSAFNRNISKTHKKLFENIFQTLETGLSKLGDNSNSQTKAIRNLIELIKDIPTDSEQGYDVLGFVYEYLIGQFASNAGKKAGEFYTPHEVSELMSEIIAHHLQDRSEIKIYDPTSGSGSLLITIGKSVSKYMNDRNNVKYYAQELKGNTYNLTRMNLVMRGIKPDNIVARNADTLEDDWPYFDESDPNNTYDPLYVDAVVSNPPYSQKWDPSDKDHDARYADYGLAPKSKADYAFLLHDLFHVKSDGIMTIVLPHGALFRGGEEGEIRKNLIEHNNIDAIIGLPANIFFGTGIPTIIIVLRQQRENEDILFVDASKDFAKEGKSNKLRACDIKKIVDVVTSRKDVEKYSRVVSREEVRKNDYNLNIPRYVDSSEEAVEWDMYATMFGGIPSKELDGLKEFWDAIPGLKEDLFVDVDVNAKYLDFSTKDIRNLINNHPKVLSFKSDFMNSLSDYKRVLKEELLSDIESVPTRQEEQKLSDILFQDLKSNVLIDPYQAYQLLHEEWEQISIDLEMIQSEGYDSIRRVDPNIVKKKKNNKETEVQEGWLGHILPFKLVQDTLLIDDFNLLKDKQDRVTEIDSEIEEVVESLTEEEREGDYFDNDSFVMKQLNSAIKALKEEDSEESIQLLNKLIKVKDLTAEKKGLNKEIKLEDANLHLKTKDTIEALSDEEILSLLEVKWVDSIMNKLSVLADNLINDFIKSLESIQKKYETTYEDIDKEIRETELELAKMIDELTGSELDMKALAEFKKMLTGDEHV